MSSSAAASRRKPSSRSSTRSSQIAETSGVPGAEYYEKEIRGKGEKSVQRRGRRGRGSAAGRAAAARERTFAPTDPRSSGSFAPRRRAVQRAAPARARCTVALRSRDPRSPPPSPARSAARRHAAAPSGPATDSPPAARRSRRRRRGAPPPRRGVPGEERRGARVPEQGARAAEAAGAGAGGARAGARRGVRRRDRRRRQGRPGRGPADRARHHGQGVRLRVPALPADEPDPARSW